jgi:muramidase (phage lysozyme)
MPERRLNNSQDLRRYLASLINRVEKGDLDQQLGKCLGYLSSLLLRAIENSETEERLEAIEQRLKSEGRL